jgi:hypothetical protein
MGVDEVVPVAVRTPRGRGHDRLLLICRREGWLGSPRRNTQRPRASKTSGETREAPGQEAQNAARAPPRRRAASTVRSCRRRHQEASPRRAFLIILIILITVFITMKRLPHDQSRR